MKLSAGRLYKGFANLGCYRAEFETFVQNKQTFLDFVFFKWSHDFLSVIFGFLGKFWILIYFLEKHIIFFRNQKNLENVREPVTRAPHDCDTLGDSTITQCITVVGSSSHGFSNAFKIFFDFEKNSMLFPKNILKSEICPGIQKSYLENRAII